MRGKDGVPSRDGTLYHASVDAPSSDLPGLRTSLQDLEILS